MNEVKPWVLGLITLAGVFLAACEDDGQPDDQGVWQSPAGSGGTAGTSGGTTGGVPPGGGTTGTAGGGGPIFPGMMPPLPDASVFMPADASVPAPRDGSVPAPPDASSPIRPDGGVADISSCTPPPAESSAKAIEAWTMLNNIRLAGGAGCINLAPALIKSAQAHCDYGAANAGNRACAPDAHTEVSSCPGFTGVNVQAREEAAGYPKALVYTEVALTYGDNPAVSIPAWLVTPYHRIPMVDPWTTDMGWGGGPRCDIIDFGRGTVRPSDTTVSMYPYDGETGVPVSFNGYEAPQPPAPAGGWPSSYPVSIYAQRIKVTEHVLTKDGDGTPLPHTFLDARNTGQSAASGFASYFTNTAVLYGAAFLPNTKYRVKMVGTYAGGALNVEWTFTTGASRPSRF
jgi:hypothetical protein